MCTERPLWVHLRPAELSRLLRGTPELLPLDSDAQPEQRCLWASLKSQGLAVGVVLGTRFSQSHFPLGA